MGASLGNVSTSLGNVSTSLTGVGASLGNVSTSLGNVSTSLTGVGTSLGNVSTSLTAVSTSLGNSISTLSASVDARFAAIGIGAATGSGSSAFGTGSLASGSNSSAYGSGAVASAANATALGQGSRATGANSTALGQGAQATGANSVAIGAGSIASDPNTVSFGAPGAERRLTNVADGINQFDAVNLGQLEKAYSGVAMSFALSAVDLPLGVGEQGFTVGVGAFEGETAGTISYRFRPTDRISIGAGISAGNGTVGGSVGIGFRFP